MATKIQQILQSYPNLSIAFSDWLAEQGLDTKAQCDYSRSGWLHRLSKGVYKMQGTEPTLFQFVSAYNNQLGKRCIIGAYSALEHRGYSHYLSLGKPKAFLFTGKNTKLPSWALQHEWDMTVSHMETSFLGDEMIGVDNMMVGGETLLVSSPERAILECLNLRDASSNLLDIYYIMESLTTLRPKLLQTLLEACSSQKVKRLFVYMAEKAAHPWFKALQLEQIELGNSRKMIVPTGKYIKRYNMTIPTELASYE